MFEGVRKWFSNLFGGNKQPASSNNRDEEEERRRRQAAQQKQQEQKQQSTQKLKTVQEQWVDQMQKQEAPLKKVDPVQQQTPQKIKTFQENVEYQRLGGDAGAENRKNLQNQIAKGDYNTPLNKKIRANERWGKMLNEAELITSSAAKGTNAAIDGLGRLP